MQAAHGGAPRVPEPDRPHVLRRIVAVMSGSVSLALIPLLWSVHREPYFATVVTVFVGLLIVAFGAGAVVLWYPKGHAGPARKILVGAVAAVIVLMGLGLVLVAG